MHIVLSKGKKTDFIALLVFFFLNKKHGRCILCLIILGVLLFSVLRGMGPAKPFRENVGPEDILIGESLTCRREEAKLCVILSEHSGWQENILEFSFIFSAAEECSYQSILT